MPINRTYPLGKVIEALQRIPLPPRRRITIAYVLVKDLNDSVKDAARLAKRLHGIRCKVNLIPFNPFPSSPLKSPSEDSILRFQKVLLAKGISTHIRVSKGRDILGACGQLAALPDTDARERGDQCNGTV
jgi:23S rRNA (adenine2503-C2)-methyltransferase